MYGLYTQDKTWTRGTARLGLTSKNLRHVILNKTKTMSVYILNIRILEIRVSLYNILLLLGSKNRLNVLQINQTC